MPGCITSSQWAKLTCTQGQEEGEDNPNTGIFDRFLLSLTIHSIDNMTAVFTYRQPNQWTVILLLGHMTWLLVRIGRWPLNIFNRVWFNHPTSYLNTQKVTSLATPKIKTDPPWVTRTLKYHIQTTQKVRQLNNSLFRVERRRHDCFTTSKWPK